jgi:hypothetical protein
MPAQCTRTLHVAHATRFIVPVTTLDGRHPIALTTRHGTPDPAQRQKHDQHDQAKQKFPHDETSTRKRKEQSAKRQEQSFALCTLLPAGHKLHLEVHGCKKNPSNHEAVFGEEFTVRECEQKGLEYFASPGVDYARSLARSVQTSDGYWHDEPCCMGEIGMPGFGCWHNIQFAGVSGAVRAEQSSCIANVKP